MGSSIVLSFRLPRPTPRPVLPERVAVPGRAQDRLGEAPDARNHAGQMGLGHREPVLSQERAPATCVERLPREGVG